MVQGAGFEPAKHYAQRPERCPFDHSGTPASLNDGLHSTSMQRSNMMSNNDGAGGRI